MRITKIDIPKDGSDGLENIKMDKLESIVLLAGKNGSGKTRILTKIFNALKTRPKKNEVINAPGLIKNAKNLIIFFNEIAIF